MFLKAAATFFHHTLTKLLGSIKHTRLISIGMQKRDFKCDDKANKLEK